MGWSCVASGVCKDISYVQELKKFQEEWLPAFHDPFPAAGAPGGALLANPHGHWGPKGGSSQYRYWECRAHIDCNRILRTTRTLAEGLKVDVKGVHTAQVS